MNLRQAYRGWSQQSQNFNQYVRIRPLFNRVWLFLDMEKPCSWYTAQILGEALAEPHIIESDKRKAAEAMLSVLEFANWAEPKWNPKPTFTVDDLMKYNHPDTRPDEKEHPEVKEETENDPCDGCVNVKGCVTCADGELREVIEEPKEEPTIDMSMEEKQKRGKQPKKVCQIDPETLKVVKTYDAITQACKEVGVKNIDRALKKKQKAGGYYWAYPEDAERFKPKEQSKPGETVKTVKVAIPKPVPTENRELSREEQLWEYSMEELLDAIRKRGRAASLPEFSDVQLIEEIKRRGWKGHLDITTSIEL